MFGDILFVIDVGVDYWFIFVDVWDVFYGGMFYELWIYGVLEFLVVGVK